MRSLRSRSVKSDSGSNKSDTEKAMKKGKRNKKAKRNSKKKTENSTDVSTENDILTKSSESTEDKTEHKTNEYSNDIVKSRRTTRHSTFISKDALKENISPNIKPVKIETNVLENESNPKKRKKKSRRNEKHTSQESLKFENVTSTAIKPKKTKKSNLSGEENKTQSLRTSRRSQNFDVMDINESKTTISKTRNSSTFEKTRNSQEYSPTFKNIVTSTTIKPKKRKSSKKSKPNTSKEQMEIDKKSNNILLEHDIINISENTETKKNVTDVLNSTYLKIDDVSTTNNSGQWNIEQQSVINISDDTKMFETNGNKEIFTSPSDKDVKKVFFQDTSLSKSARKKWQRFPRNSQGANSILEQISTPRKKSLPNKSLNISQKLNKTGNTTSTQSANKIKRTAMPNFALIHQKAYEKMESISEYSQRKKDRANLLLSNKKIQPTENETGNKTENKIKSSRQLFSEKPDTLKLNRFGFKSEPNTTNKPFNRFGFKSNTITNKPLKPVKPLENSRIPLKPLKPAFSEREEVLAIANKKPQITGKLRDNKRDLLKGVRTNRRFELLMKMRNN